MQRYGITIPFDGVPLHEQGKWFAECEELGYTDLWSSEANGNDGFTPLAVAAGHTRTAELGIAIVPVYLRGPALLAQTVAAMTEAAPGRFLLGVGSSSNVIVERWNGVPFEEPYRRTRDTVRFLKQALTGEKVDFQGEGIDVRGFRLGRRPAEMPRIVVAALRPGMLRMAGRESEGAVINWLSADDVAKVVPEVAEGAGGAPREIVARIFVCPSEDTARVRAMGRFVIASYLTVPVYAEFHRWLGRGEALTPMWNAWQQGDRRAATEAIPDDVVDQLIVHGSPDQCREHIDRYVQNGVTRPVLAVLPAGGDLRQAMRDLAPSAR